MRREEKVKKISKTAGEAKRNDVRKKGEQKMENEGKKKERQ